LNDYDKIYSYFDNGNVYSTAKRIFNYLKENIKYQIESENTQTLTTHANSRSALFKKKKLKTGAFLTH
jgi:bisphosphoglycerate-dependent phosphoglycerate mutase